MNGITRIGIVLGVATASLAFACGDGTRCRDARDCPPTPSIVAQQAEASPEPTATPPPTGTAEPLTPLRGAQVTPTIYSSTPTPIPPPPTEVPSPPTITSTPIPPLPGTFPTRPPDPPYTPEPRPDLPTAADMYVGTDGKYYAFVDGCRWDEVWRGPHPLTGATTVTMQSPCLPNGGIHYSPSTGEVTEFVQ